MQFIKLFSLISLSLWLVACSNFPAVQQIPPTQISANYLFKVEELEPKQQASLLILQIEPQQWRWILNDPLGAPISRMILTAQGWEREGFVPPNEQAKYLFAAIASYLEPQAQLFAVSSSEQNGQVNYYDKNKLVWSLIPNSQGVKIKLYDNSQWFVTKLTP